ncbi:hypothetical protein [Parabacteroides gordonii]|jgi:hypothetical protein|uniref:Uncharacterized protein n=1 Tax=Parabacteroides gordonii MS-1 = DSM 23371 TaxID=1203610 RepID=A0A0F5JJS6_9BACT|nr:hypothetical protein [Parabacteroides gordonii]KKB57974.1 hypothetical protein HMPREF1536_01783 [Parabacteroides gordonii MS-1 = DSM 23371]MCA5582838.1 hypothetical protein [Parabacteroides gordonii]
MENKIKLAPLSQYEMITVEGGNQMAEDMGSMMGEAVGRAIKMFLFCAAIYAL